MDSVSAGAPDRSPQGRADADDLYLMDVGLREAVELVRMDLPDNQKQPLLERGVLPGCRLCLVRHSPFGDPVVEVEGMVLALRREMARCLCVRRAASNGG